MLEYLQGEGVMVTEEKDIHNTCAFSPERQAKAMCELKEKTSAGLFEPITFRSVTIRSRIGVSPMCQYNSVDGMANDWHLVHLGCRAVGGAGLVMTEGTSISPEGRITPDDLGIWKDEHIEPLARVVRFITSYGAVAGIQLAHAGRKASTANPWKSKSGRHVRVDLSDQEGGWQPVAPSPIKFQETSRELHELTIAEIKAIQAQFVEGTKRALKAGFQLFELHAAHGYLCHNFYSPLSNQRTDAYGGSFDNRIRFTLETVESMRKEIPDHLPMGVRLSCTDWMDGGWTLDESIELAKILKAMGIDFIDCSSGYGVSHARYPHGPGWQVPLSEAIRKKAQIATAAVGEITTPEQAAEIISSGKADLVFLAREFMREPYWPYEAARKLQLKDVQTLPPNYTYAI
jgi:2,4-dienoyl-CoA reductase-like NADH-dependent reductase (Old Yellow Enzyme family)